MISFRTFLEDSEGQRVLIVMRGVPGSGKSHKAKQLKGDTGVIFSTDDFWGDDDESYKANWAKAQADGTVWQKLGEYHGKNLARAVAAMDQGISPIIIDNTNIKPKAFKPYVEEAKKRGYSIRIEESDLPQWKDYRSGKMVQDKAAEFFHKNNQHGVPLQTIRSMLAGFQDVDDTQNESSLRDLLQPVPQSPKWHKEGDVFAHTRLVRKGIDVAIGLIKDAIASPQFSAFSGLDPNFTDEDRNLLRIGGWMHDVGKSSATTANKGKWSPGMEVSPDDRIQAIGHEMPRHFVRQGQKLGAPWRGMFQNAQTGDKRDLAFMIANHMSLRNGTFGKRVAQQIIDPATGKYKNERRIKLLLTLILMDQMGRFGTGEPQFGLANGIESLRQMQNTSDQIMAAQQKSQRQKPQFETPDQFRAFLQNKGLNPQQIEDSVRKKFQHRLNN